MLSFHLNKNLDAITSGTNLREVVFKLIKKAESQNWIENLIYGAIRENPGNEKLKCAARALNFNLSSNFNSEPQSEFLEGEVNNSALIKIPVTGDKASEVGADYTKLRNLLENKEFGKADLEILRIIL